MDKTIAFLPYWYYHLPNFVLAALMYTLLGRVILGLFLDHDSPNYIWRFFCRITDPVIAVFELRHAEGDRARRLVAVRVRLAVLAAGAAARTLFLAFGALPRLS